MNITLPPKCPACSLALGHPGAHVTLKRQPVQYVVDECPDAHGFWTIRIADGTPNGNTDEPPIATIYTLEDAEYITALLNAD